ncbi:hypothetical protein [Halobacillus hunanensis]|nr:hypothetical protein [Halobacillus hunanensis]
MHVLVLVLFCIATNHNMRVYRQQMKLGASIVDYNHAEATSGHPFISIS